MVLFRAIDSKTRNCDFNLHTWPHTLHFADGFQFFASCMGSSDLGIYCFLLLYTLYSYIRAFFFWVPEHRKFFQFLPSAVTIRVELVNNTFSFDTNIQKTTYILLCKACLYNTRKIYSRNRRTRNFCNKFTFFFHVCILIIKNRSNIVQLCNVATRFDAQPLRSY